MMLLRDDAASAALFPRALPVADAGAMHGNNFRDHGRASQPLDDGFSGLHPNHYVANFATVGNWVVAKRETDGISTCWQDRYMDAAKWFRDALASREMKQAEMSRRLTAELKRSIDRAAVQKITTGVRNLSADEMVATSKITGYPMPAGALPRVRLVGIVGDDAQVAYQALDRETVQGLESATSATEALEIRSSSLGALFDRWILFYQRSKTVQRVAIGQSAIVGLPDGRTLIRKLDRSKSNKKLFHLTSDRASTVLDTAVEWASPFRIVAPVD